MSRRFGRIPSTAGFQTFQTVMYYEEALSRHMQWLRWMKAIRCPCVSYASNQPDPKCSLCKGRGFIYKPASGPFQILEEQAPHDNYGRVHPWFQPIIVGTALVKHKGVWIDLDPSQPVDGSYIQLISPWPRNYSRIWISYEFNPEWEITNENSDIYSSVSPFTLRTKATIFMERGKTFEGSVISVSRVRNITKSETYAVTSFEKEYIYLQNMGTWQVGDVLEVDYKYVKPYGFLLVGVTPRIRYENPYVLDEAESLLMTPYYTKIASNDLFTALASEQRAEVILNPNNSGTDTDEIGNYYDLSKIIMIMDKNGVEYNPRTSVQLIGRNKIKWLITKPTVNYTVQFTYHPTYTSISTYSALRTAENKEFINRINLKLFDRLDNKRSF